MAILLALELWLTVGAWPCDEQFIQEPTTAEPTKVEHDTVAGLLYVTYAFVDGRELVVVYQTRDFLSEPEPHPLFYIATGKDHVSITYVDREGSVNCYEIHRY